MRTAGVALMFGWMALRVPVALAGPPVGSVAPATWDKVARCESGARWADRRGGYEGGLHFSPWTWRRAGGARFAAHGYLATRAQQIDVANRWLARTSWRQWPTCSRRLGLR